MPEGLRTSSVVRDSLAAAAIVSFPLWQALAGVKGPVDLTLNIGPNDAAYLSGFYPDFQIENENTLATRWSTYRASINLPVVVEGGPVELAYRVERVLPQTAVVDVFFGGDVADRFTCRGGGYLVRRMQLAALSPTRAHLDFEIDSHDRRNLGLKFDWVRIRVGDAGSVTLGDWHRWGVLFFLLFLFGLFRWTGFSSLTACALVLPAAIAAGVWTRLDPLAAAHVASKIALAAALLSLASALVVRKRRRGRWLVVVFVASLLFKGIGLFHPRYWYIDIQNHRRYVNAFAEASGSVVERGIAAQKKVNTAYPRTIAGKDYAFPYSPLPFVPFSWLPQERNELLDDSMNHVALAATAVQVLVVYGLGRVAAGPSVGLAAAFFHAFLPAPYSRLLLYMWPTICAHLLDSLAILTALLLALRPEDRRRTLGLAALTLASFLSYISSLFTLSLFLVFFAILVRPLRRSLVLILLGAGAATVLLLYRDFTMAFFREILPALIGEGAGDGAPPSTIIDAVSRIPLFYGYVVPVLALAGLYWVRRRGSPEAFRTLLAYGLAFAALVALRGLGGGLFKDLKEILFVAPLVAVLAAVAVTEIAKRGRVGMGVAIGLSMWLVVFGTSRYRRYFETYRYPAVAEIIEEDGANNRLR